MLLTAEWYKCSAAEFRWAGHFFLTFSPSLLCCRLTTDIAELLFWTSQWLCAVDCRIDTAVRQNFSYVDNFSQLLCYQFYAAWWLTIDVHVAEFLYWPSQCLCAVDCRLILLQCSRSLVYWLVGGQSLILTFDWYLQCKVILQSPALLPADVHINGTLILHCSRNLETNDSDHC